MNESRQPQFRITAIPSDPWQYRMIPAEEPSLRPPAASWQVWQSLTRPELHRDQQPKNLVHVAAIAQWIVQNRPHNGLRIHDENRSHRLGRARRRLKHSKARETSIVRSLITGNITSMYLHALVVDLLFDSPQPRNVVCNVLSIDMASNLVLSILKPRLCIGESHERGRAHRREVRWMREEHHPLSLEVF